MTIIKEEKKEGIDKYLRNELGYGQVQQWKRLVFEENMGNVMSDIFGYFAETINGEIPHIQGQFFAEFAYNNMLEVKQQIVYQCEQEYVPYFWEQIKCVIDYLTYYQDDFKYEKMPELKADLNDLERLKKRNQKVDADLLLYVYMVLRTHWNILKKSTRTYGLLAAISRLQVWSENEENKLKLMQILKEIEK